jgi:hypothetical protein
LRYAWLDVLPAARTQDRDRQQSPHGLTLAHVCLLVVAACGNEAAKSDAGPSCESTADPHDEDGDGRFDDCDNCPAIANPTQSDATEIAVRAFADGVGDACDPRPSLAGDDLRAFYSFASEDQANAWTGSGFTISGDALHATDAATWTSTRTAQGDGLFVLAQITSLTFGVSGDIAVALDGDGIGAGATCTLGAQLLTASEPAGAMTSVDLSSAIEPGDPVRLIAWRTVATTPSGRVPRLTCRVTHAAATKDAIVMLTDDLVSGGQVIAVRDTSLEMSSLSIYTSPAPRNP